MKNLHVVMGGLGKNIIFTSLIPSLCEKDDTDKVSIMTPWPFVFNSNERVESIEHPMGWEYYSNLSKYDNIIYHEPYLSNYIKTEKLHILDAWADMYGIEKVFPKPYINIKNIVDEYELSETLKQKEYCVVQFNGGKVGGCPNKNEARDYRLDKVQSIIYKIRHKLELDVICFRYEDEPKPSDTITFKSKTERGTLGIIPIIDKAKFVVCIDSALMHFSASTNKNERTIVLWNKNQTQPERIGYDFQTNIITDNDVCIDVDSQIVFDKILEVTQ